MMPLVWALWAISVWTCGSGQLLSHENVTVLYSELRSDVIIACDCFNISCDSVYWFRSLLRTGKVEFIGKSNIAQRVTHGNVTKERFKLSQRGSSSFVLRVLQVTEADTGTYSCIIKDKRNNELWKPGTLLRPGVAPPTAPSKVKKPPVKPVCRCPAKTLQQDGCGSLVLWPLVGVISFLSLALVCMLYYFSRLPKKCRHHFMKK